MRYPLYKFIRALLDVSYVTDNSRSIVIFFFSFFGKFRDIFYRNIILLFYYSMNLYLFYNVNIFENIAHYYLKRSNIWQHKLLGNLFYYIYCLLLRIN